MKGKKIVLDTDVIIDYLRNDAQAVTYIENQLSAQMLLSVINVAELYAGIRNKEEKQAIENFLRVFEIISINKEIAEQGGEFRKTYGKSHGTGLADALIAATAIQQNATLITLNIHHYPMIEAITPYKKESVKT